MIMIIFKVVPIILSHSVIHSFLMYNFIGLKFVKYLMKTIFIDFDTY